MKKNVYKNWSRFLLVTLLLLIMATGLNSCGKDNEESEPAVNPIHSLIGAWTRNIRKPDTESTPWKTILTFNSNGKLSITTFITGSLDQGGGIGEGIVTGEYDYVVEKNIIKLSSMTESGTLIVCSNLYNVDGDNLHLEYISGPKPSYIFFPDNVFEVTYTR